MFSYRPTDYDHYKASRMMKSVNDQKKGDKDAHLNAFLDIRKHFSKTLSMLQRLCCLQIPPTAMAPKLSCGWVRWRMYKSAGSSRKGVYKINQPYVHVYMSTS